MIFRYYRYLAALVLTVVIVTSCVTEVVPLNYFNANEPFNLFLNSNKDIEHINTLTPILISPNSTLASDLSLWLFNNKDDWKSGSASYLSDVRVVQKDFHLLYNRDGSRVDISIIDLSGNRREYGKNVTRGELNFLFK